jgi:tetratricopeptide (TPR) repeat protein
MMRQNAGLLISLAATMLATSGCSPFQAKLHRRDTDNQVSQHVQPASYSARPTGPQPRPGIAELPLDRPSPKTPEVDDKTKQWIALARLSERREQYEQADKIFAQIIERVPDHPLPYHRMAIMRAKQSKFQEAEQYFAKAYELNPSDARLLSDIGYFYYLTSDSARAEQFLRYALEIDPQHEAAHNNLAVLVGEHGDLEEARKYFRRVGNESQTETNMAFVYAQRGDLAQAVNLYSRALTLDKDNRPAAYALLSLAKHKPTQAGPARGPETPQTPSSSRQPSVMDVSSSAGRQPTPAQPRQPYRPAEITTGQPAALDRGVAVAHQPVRVRPKKALLTHLSDFASSLNNERPTQPVAAEVTEDNSTPSPTAPQPEVLAKRETPPAHSDASTPAEDKEPLVRIEEEEPSATTCPPFTPVKCADVSASRAVAPLGRLQHRLNRLRCDSDGENCDNDSAASKSRGVVVYQSPEFRPTVSLSISDKPVEGVSPASYSPAKGNATDETGPADSPSQEALPESAKKGTSDTRSDSLHPQRSDDTSAEDSSDTGNTFLNSWLTPEAPRESSRRTANHSSRRGA